MARAACLTGSSARKAAARSTAAISATQSSTSCSRRQSFGRGGFSNPRQPCRVVAFSRLSPAVRGEICGESGATALRGQGLHQPCYALVTRLPPGFAIARRITRVRFPTGFDEGTVNSLLLDILALADR